MTEERARWWRRRDRGIPLSDDEQKTIGVFGAEERRAAERIEKIKAREPSMIELTQNRDVLEEILATLQRIEANQKRGRWHR